MPYFNYKPFSMNVPYSIPNHFDIAPILVSTFINDHREDENPILLILL